jgi:hypothetical protein
MISREMKPYDWNRPDTGIDSYGQSVSTITPLGTIVAAIYFDSQASVNNPLCVEATHIGLTADKTVQRLDIIDSFEVLQVNPAGRLNQLVMKKV